MKRTQILATLVFAFVLGAAVPFIELASSTNVSAAEQNQPASEGISTPLTSDSTTQADTPAREVTVTAADATQLSDIFNNPNISKIIIGENINYSKRITINRPVDKPLVVEFKDGSKIEYTQRKSSKYAVRLERGNVTFTGTGTIAGSNGFYVLGTDDATVTENTILTIDKDVTVQGLDVYALVVSDNPKYNSVNYGTRVYLNGKFVGPYGISVDGFVHNSDQAPVITIGDTATITSSVGAAIYAAGYANWTFGAAQITGNMGIGIKSGTMTLNGTQITATGAPATPDPTTGNIDENGVAFSIEHNNDYADQIVLNLNGGTYTSQNTSVFYEYSDADLARAATRLADINIAGGTFTAGGNDAIFGGRMADTDIEISGGTFTTGGPIFNENILTDTGIQISGGTFTGTDTQTDQFKNYLAEGLIIATNGQVMNPAAPVRPSRPSSSTSSPEAPEDPSDPVEPSDPTPEQKPSNDQNTAPDTGLNHGRGVLTAASTVIPLICGAIGVIFMVCVQKVFSRRKALNAAAVEMEIDEQIAEIVDEPEEPVVERFVAEAIERPEPKVTPVDTFILQK